MTMNLRLRAIQECHLCDDRGRRNGWTCQHSNEHSEAAARGAAIARTLIRPTRETKPQEDA